MNIKSIVKNFIKRFSSKYLRNVFNTRYSKNVLIVYLIESFKHSPSSDEFLFHSSRVSCYLIAQAFKECLYNVDVIGWNDIETASKIDKKYDIVIGLGGAYSYLIENKSDLFKIKIYYSTGAPAHYQNEAEKKRIDEINIKYKANLRVQRYNDENDDLLKSNDYIISLGNKYSANRYLKYTDKKIFEISPHTYLDHNFYDSNKDWSKVKNSFMFLTGKGKALCCLDLLLEIAKENSDIHLYICGVFDGEEDFESIFYEYIYNTPNVKFIGWCAPYSKEMESVTSSCAHIIMPVVSGGANGSVLIGMTHGLIPIHSIDSGIDDNVNGFIINEYTKESILKKMNEAMNMSELEFRTKSLNVHNLVYSKYTGDLYKENFINIIKNIENENSIH